MSLPLRECGLKYRLLLKLQLYRIVTPLAGVWIEIYLPPSAAFSMLVTPLAGVWIEICKVNHKMTV